MTTHPACRPRWARLLTACVLLLLAALPGPSARAQNDAPTPDPAVLVLLRARADLERLADVVLGGPQRPDGWSGNSDPANPQLALLLRLDVETLADQVTPGQRPAGWFGVVATTPYALARDARHDLELLADTLIAYSVRPSGWQGDDPLMRCDRATQSLVWLLLGTGGFAPLVDPLAPDFCARLNVEAGRFVETTPGLLLSAGGGGAATTPGSVSVDALRGAPAYTTRQANALAGIIPPGVLLQPVAASRASYSRMVLVRGDGFEVFVDFTDTTMGAAAFAALPNVDAVSANPFCNGPAWCR